MRTAQVKSNVARSHEDVTKLIEVFSQAEPLCLMKPLAVFPATLPLRYGAPGGFLKSVEEDREAPFGHLGPQNDSTCPRDSKGMWPILVIYVLCIPPL